MNDSGGLPNIFTIRSNCFKESPPGNIGRLIIKGAFKLLMQAHLDLFTGLSAQLISFLRPKYLRQRNSEASRLIFLVLYTIEW